MASEVRSCKCEHKSQDAIHGAGQRVYNPTTKGLRCTVCGTEINTGSGSAKAKK